VDNKGVSKKSFYNFFKKNPVSAILSFKYATGNCNFNMWQTYFAADNSMRTPINLKHSTYGHLRCEAVQCAEMYQHFRANLWFGTESCGSVSISLASFQSHRAESQSIASFQGTSRECSGLLRKFGAFILNFIRLHVKRKPWSEYSPPYIP
jgi:hypothetical protein